jgi:hypothetical protein
LRYPDLRMKAYNVFNIPVPRSVIGIIQNTSGSKSYNRINKIQKCPTGEWQPLM